VDQSAVENSSTDEVERARISDEVTLLRTHVTALKRTCAETKEMVRALTNMLGKRLLSERVDQDVDNINVGEIGITSDEDGEDLSKISAPPARRKLIQTLIVSGKKRRAYLHSQTQKSMRMLDVWTFWFTRNVFEAMIPGLVKHERDNLFKMSQCVALMSLFCKDGDFIADPPSEGDQAAFAAHVHSINTIGARAWTSMVVFLEEYFPQKRRHSRTFRAVETIITKKRAILGLSLLAAKISLKSTLTDSSTRKITYKRRCVVDQNFPHNFSTIVDEGK
jgi:hypothetical protein